MYFGGVRNGYDSSTPSLPPFFYSHIGTIETFRATCHELALKLMRCFAISFGLDPEYFANGTLLLLIYTTHCRTQGDRTSW
jgi:isopenicillin N synthase-like dioxygenase